MLVFRASISWAQGEKPVSTIGNHNLGSKRSKGNNPEVGGQRRGRGKRIRQKREKIHRLYFVGEARDS